MLSEQIQWTGKLELLIDRRIVEPGPKLKRTSLVETTSRVAKSLYRLSNLLAC